MADDQSAAVVPADLRNVDTVLAAARDHRDFSQPIGRQFIACLQISPTPMTNADPVWGYCGVAQL